MSWHKPRVRLRSRVEAVNAALSSLRTITALSRMYEDGDAMVARDLAVCIARLMNEEFVSSGLRKELRLPSYCMPNAAGNEAAFRGHVITRITVNEAPPALVEFRPHFYDNEFHPGFQTGMKFSEWGGEVIIEEGSAGFFGFFLPKDRHYIPKNKRRKVLRRDFVNIFRNERGAHFDRNESAGHAFINNSDLQMEIFCAGQDGKTWSSRSSPEMFIYKNSVSECIIRGIAEEVNRSNAEEILGSELAKHRQVQ